MTEKKFKIEVQGVEIQKSLEGLYLLGEYGRIGRLGDNGTEPFIRFCGPSFQSQQEAENNIFKIYPLFTKKVAYERTQEQRSYFEGKETLRTFQVLGAYTDPSNIALPDGVQVSF